MLSFFTFFRFHRWQEGRLFLVIWIHISHFINLNVTDAKIARERRWIVRLISMILKFIKKGVGEFVFQILNIFIVVAIGTININWKSSLVRLCIASHLFSTFSTIPDIFSLLFIIWICVIRITLKVFVNKWKLVIKRWVVTGWRFKVTECEIVGLVWWWRLLAWLIVC